ncbi:hypothetical protein MKQ68_14100 [Chitinophaga horti]|uniref:DUF2268 domain-containing protein n=1 Tax=Chitinophaga horti TaxID=2920382 RepID=A0ABY6IYY9_9BACT|nr:hypothetical protein [Chitinophaga horti]UYQ91224.1 hypothetical protein MKQ68_14100 [Chitinophaga horti]
MKSIKYLLKWLFIIIATAMLCFFAAMAWRNLRVNSDETNFASAHFTVHYRGIYNSEAQTIADALERNYDRINRALANPPHKKIDVHIHPTQSAFNMATGLTGSHANGTSRGPHAFHIMYQTWFNSIFPANNTQVAVHEFTHCVQLNILITEALESPAFAGSKDFDQKFEARFAKDYPQWLWESLSDYEAGIVNKTSVGYGMRSSPRLDDLNHGNRVYQVGYTVIEYLVHQFGADKLPAFVRSYGDIEQVLHVSKQDFEKGWLSFVAERY